MKYIIHSLDARNKKKPFYRESVGWDIKKFAEDIFFTDNPHRATQFDNGDRARRFAREILILDLFEIEDVQ